MSPGLFVPAYMKHAVFPHTYILHAAFPQLPIAKAVLANSYIPWWFVTQWLLEGSWS